MTTRIAIYPGSFDPITIGHMDLVRRGLRLFDKLIVGIGINSQKQPMFAASDRGVMIAQAINTLPVEDVKRVQIDTFHGMLGDFAKERGADYILRGMRTLSDFDFEFQIAYANQALYPDIETVFVATDPKLAAVSSSVVREVIRRGEALKDTRDRRLERFVPDVVAKYIRETPFVAQFTSK